MSTPVYSKAVNIVNFIRNTEPRMKMDLKRPVREQMRLAKQYHLPTTWLLQYDSLCGNFYVPFLKENMPENHEVGIWFEIVQEQVEAAGLKWRGRYSWDWHSDKAFSVGYSEQEREKLADVMMEKFRSVFGYYPRVMGAWFFDAYLLNYLSEKYGLDAACSCKDQYGTDGYTLWGGYWANAYYPSKKNSYFPAVKKESQIPVPVFRMLGSDPLYQYCANVTNSNGQTVISLEPVYSGYENKAGGGGVPAWCDWFFQENFRDENMNFSYAQAGQENSFGWPAMEKGLEYQYRKLAELRDSGVLYPDTLGNTGRNFKRRFSQTPATSVVVREDWRKENHQTIWYLSRLNRLNFFRDDSGELILRDIHLWNDDKDEEFLHAVCRSNLCKYAAFPVIDGMRWNAELCFLPDGKREKGILGKVENSPDGESMSFEWIFESSGVLKISCHPGSFSVDASNVTGGKMDIVFQYDKNAAVSDIQKMECFGGGIEYVRDGFRYDFLLSGGIWHETDNGEFRAEQISHCDFQIKFK